MNLIYEPKGAAGEYAKYAVNFYNGCSNRCAYCYNRKGVAAKVLGQDVPVLKKAILDEWEKARKAGSDMSAGDVAYNMFCKDIEVCGDELRKHELFFNFVSDPMLDETHVLNGLCIEQCIKEGIPVRVLTKAGNITSEEVWWILHCSGADGEDVRKYLTVGFTLTGCDELEPGADSNMERIRAMKSIHSVGIRTWASIEPVIDLKKSARMILDSLPYCDEYRIGLLSGKKNYTPDEVKEWKKMLENVFAFFDKKLVWKKSVMEYINKAL